MLEETLTALAAAGGTAVVQAAGTDAWKRLRETVAGLLGRGAAEREHAVLERLDQTVIALESATGNEPVAVQRQEASWQARFEALFDELAEADRQRAADQLRDLLAWLDQQQASQTPQSASITMTATVSGNGTSYQAGRDIRINHG
ncbi:hypothetical protein [Kitasatospora kifunensis]|uniref:Uncharacterized protein n=1 Tax=Kitasatospora kifunensis TaxID=58351 RepID=A0A7W7R4G2_KITKI|nr:hypothetical protein [Kitasatospora kifunensis]MBB4925013.1 hypothetical protein [Kitasatospora kifunensis]